MQTETLPGVSAADFKATMRRFASSVTVVTSGCDGACNGMTATAVCSVSADPASVLIVVNQANRSHDLIRRSGAYTVNLLSAAQQPLAKHFAASTADPFATVQYCLGRNACPIIADCAGYLECVVDTQMQSGTHTVFVGRVVGAGGSELLPLIYFDGGFRG